VVLPLLLYRRIRCGYAFRRISLTMGLYAIVDPDKFRDLIKYKWCALKGQRTFYATRRYTERRRVQKVISMHRKIMQAAEGEFIDHINHKGLDNRVANLRPATRCQNAWNRQKPNNNSRSRYKGITYNRREKKWLAKIQVEGDSKFLGAFNDEIEAAKVYDEAAKKYFGEFAALNFE
jgi:hypothetical protein